MRLAPISSAPCSIFISFAIGKYVPKRGCWEESWQPHSCCIPPAGHWACFPEAEKVFTYEACCALSEEDHRSELTNGGWLDTRYFRAGFADFRVYPPSNPISPEDLMKTAGHPYVHSWISPFEYHTYLKEESECHDVFAVLLLCFRQLRTQLVENLKQAFQRQDSMMGDFHNRVGTNFDDAAHLPSYRSLYEPLMLSYRFCLNMMETANSLILIFGWRCFPPELRVALARIVAVIKDLAVVYVQINFSVTHLGLYALREESTHLSKQVQPLWAFYDRLAEVAAHSTHLIGMMDHEAVVHSVGHQRSQTSFGAFSESNLLKRQVFDAWHLDHGLVASLLRLWPEEDGNKRTSIADFGAGSGHYCAFFNKTEQFDCFAFDGAENISEYSKGRVSYLRLDQEFDLQRKFDWVMSLEVAEHLPQKAAHVFVQNLRRHALTGLVLSWSTDFHHEVHPNAMAWDEVKLFIEDHGFLFDGQASERMKPVLSWMRGNVHVFRAV